MTARSLPILSSEPAIASGLWKRTVAALLPERAAERYRLYIALALLLYVGAWGIMVLRAQLKHQTIDFAFSDAVGYYVYLPSIVIDGDTQFENQLLVQFGGRIDEDIAKMMRVNRWPAGVAMVLAPAFLAAHGVSHLLYALTGSPALAPNGYTVPYFIACVAWAMAIGTLGMIVADRLLVERFKVSGRLAGAAVLTLWLGTNYIWYSVREPLMAHMVGASLVIFAVYLIHRVEQTSRERRLVWWHLPLLALVTSLALACRMTNAFLLPLFVYLLVVLVRRGLIVQALRVTPLVLVALAPLAVQAMAMQMTTGQVVHNTVQGMGYRRFERFFWTDPALLRSLISSHHGLFFWTPALLLATWGIIWHMLRRRGWRDPLLVCLVLSGLVLWYVNSAWYAWWFGHSMGNRAYVELAGLFIIGFGLAFTWLGEVRLSRRKVLLAALGLAFAYNYVLIGLKMVDVIEGDEPLLMWEQQVFTGRWRRI